MFLSEKAPPISVGDMLTRSVVNGPGERFVLWVRGCPFRCPGCINPQFLAFENRNLIRVETLAETVLSVSGIDGVTYSGGEPMAQAEGLFHLTRALKAQGLTAVSYSGYTLEELQTHPDPFVPLFLEQLDLLLDGRYIAEQNGFLPWRGSLNQRAHFLSDAYRHLEQQTTQPHRETEFVISESKFTTTGIFDHQMERRLENLLAQPIDHFTEEIAELERVLSRSSPSSKEKL